MPNLIHCRSPRCVLAAFSLLWLSACEADPSIRAAQLQLIAASEPTVCDSTPPGDLRLEGLDAKVRSRIPGAELCSGAPIQRELPPGLYTLSWQGRARPAAFDTAEASPLRGPTVVSLFAGQITLVRVQLEVQPPSLCSGSS